MPAEVEQVVAAEETPVVTTQSAADPAPPPEPPPAAADPAPEVTAESAAEWQGVLDATRGMGVELPYPDDRQALAGLVETYRKSQERDYYRDLGRRFAPHARDIQQYIEDRRTAAQAPQAPPAWQPPEFRKEWAQMVERDPDTGTLRAKAGYDPGLAEKVQAYADWREGFLESPEKVVAPLVEQRAAQLIDARFADFTARAEADRVLQQKTWLYQAGSNGRAQLSPAGVVYQQAVQSLAAAGVNDVKMCDRLATQAVENAVLRARYAASGGGQTLTQAAPAATGIPAVGGGNARPAAGVPASAASTRGNSLRELLNNRLNKFNDADSHFG